jgi:peptidoglycan hydrolase-like protein with peptidoglycan-binding domain
VSNGAGSEVSLHARIDRFAMNKSEAELMSIQRSLKQLGHYNLNIDGKYGPGTRRAIASAVRAGQMSL